jgi:hypothetical protein
MEDVQPSAVSSGSRHQAGRREIGFTVRCPELVRVRSLTHGLSVSKRTPLGIEPKILFLLMRTRLQLLAARITRAANHIHRASPQAKSLSSLDSAGLVRPLTS